jgi:hypothetical protein
VKGNRRSWQKTLKDYIDSIGKSEHYPQIICLKKWNNKYNTTEKTKIVLEPIKAETAF